MYVLWWVLGMWVEYMKKIYLYWLDVMILIFVCWLKLYVGKIGVFFFFCRKGCRCVEKNFVEIFYWNFNFIGKEI